MINIHVLYNKDAIKKITLKGHALYDDYGKDIVCAAVSATYLCTVNAIYTINEKSIEVKNQTITVKENDKTIKLLLENMIRCLESLEKQYPKNIKLDKEEE